MIQIISIDKVCGIYEGKEYIVKTHRFCEEIKEDNTRVDLFLKLSRFLDEQEERGFTKCLQYKMWTLHEQEFPYTLWVRMAFLR